MPAIIRSRVVPATLEFMDKHCIRAVDQYLKVGLPQGAEAFLLIEVDGFASELPRAMDTLKSICLDNGAMDIRVASDEKERARLWKIRRSISAATSRYPIRGDGEDIVVPDTGYRISSAKWMQSATDMGFMPLISATPVTATFM